METRKVAAHSVTLLKLRDGRELVVRNEIARGGEEELLVVRGHSRGDGVVVVVDNHQTTTPGSFDDVVRIVEERFEAEHARRHRTDT